MEPITLITTALTLATPYLIKTGEKFAEGIGEDIWKWIKKPFTSEEEKEIISNFQLDRDSEQIKTVLLEKFNQDIEYKHEFGKAIDNAQKQLNSYSQQKINNNAAIEKQVNIQNLNGNLNF